LDGSAPRLAWDARVTGFDGSEYSVQSVYVDALTGAVLGTQEHVSDGTGNTVWNGPTPVQIATTHSGSNFLLRDPAHPTEQCQDAANNRTFTKTTDTWGNGNATNRETGCADAMFVIQKENAMLSQWLGRNSFDGNGGGWPIRVGLNDENAFYDGTQVQVGHNTAGQWITSLDVVAHEHGHGIDDHTPGGISRGATQEFVADVFGASTEWFANEPAPFDTPDFLVGERINLVGTGPIRNMFNPSAINNNPNCFSSSVPNGEVHASAGPGNHWFYLVAEGTNPTNGQPTSPTCNNSRVTGIGVQAAVTIFYNAMLRKTTASGYPRYRLWTLQAAKALTPGNCTNFNTVKAAWNAVSVPAQAGEPACP
jgi:Zn-dependent metalloprotease